MRFAACTCLCEWLVVQAGHVQSPRFDCRSIQHMQDEDDEAERQQQYLEEHGRPEWADIMCILPEDWEVLQRECPDFCRTGPEAETVAYFKAGFERAAARKAEEQA